MIFTIKKYSLWLCGMWTALLAVWAVGFLLFVSELERQALPQETVTTDAVVVFTGGRERVAQGLKLLKESRAQQLLISGVGQDVTLEALLQQDELEALGVEAELRRRITLGYEAANTEGNARETRDWVEEHGIQSIRLVTAYYHMPRSRLEFQLMMPETALVLHPVFPQEAALFSEEGLRIALVEYHKFIAVLLRQAGLWPR